MRVLVDQPEIPGNTGNLIRLAAVTGTELHVAEPLGFDLDDTKLKRAGLDYHDLAVLTIHPDFDAAMRALAPARVFAFTTTAKTWHTSVSYQPGDVLLFGRESSGLDREALDHPRITDQVRIPMLPSRRSLNIANSVSIGLYEAWRQVGFDGAR